MLGQGGRSLQPAQGGGLVTAGPELGVSASLRVLHVGLGAVLLLVLLALPSLLSPPLPCCLTGSDNTPARGKEAVCFCPRRCLCPLCAPTQLSLLLNTGEREKQTLLHVISSAVSWPGPGSSPGTQSGSRPVPRGGGPQVPAFVTDWDFLRGRVGRRDIHTDGAGVFCEARAVSLGRHPSPLLLGKGTVD